MTRHSSHTALLAALFVGAAGISAAQPTPQSQDPHHPGGAPEAAAEAPNPVAPPIDMPPEPAADLSFARPWLTRRTGECRWPVGEPERPADQLMCCAPVGCRGDYCPTHRPHMSRRPRDAEAFVEQIMNFLQQKRGSR